MNRKITLKVLTEIIIGLQTVNKFMQEGIKASTLERHLKSNSHDTNIS